MADGFITLQTEDGLVIENVPSNLADPQNQKYSQEIRDYVADLRSKGETGTFQYQAIEAQPITQQPEVIQQPQQVTQPQQQTILEDLAGGTGATLRGAIPLLTAEMVSTPIVDTVNRLLGTNIQRPAEAMSELFTRIGIEEPDTEAEKLVQAMSEGAIGAMTSIGAGGLLQAGKGLGQTVAKGVGQTLSAQPAAQITGAVMSAGGAQAAGELARSKGASPLVQTVAEVGGGLAGGSLANIPGALSRTSVSMPDVSLIDDAQARGVRILTSDIREPKTFLQKWAQTVSEKIPLVGTGGVRAAQQKERVEAVKDLLNQYGAVGSLDDVTDEIMDSALKLHKQKIVSLSNAKNEVIDKLTGDVVPVTKTIAQIDDEISKLKSLKTSDVQPVIDQLETFKSAIQDQDLNNIEQLRSILAKSFQGADNVKIRDVGQKSLDSIYNPLREDMGDFIKANGTDADYNKWRISNRKLSEGIKDLEGTALKKALRSGDITPETIKNVLFNQKRSEVSRLYHSLNTEGKKKAQAAILLKAFEGGQINDKLSPDKFANALSKLGRQTGIFFKQEDEQALKGLKRVLDATKRAGRAEVSTPTGQQLIPFATAGAGASLGEALGIGSAPGTILTAATIGGLSNLYESKAGRELLKRLPIIKHGSAEEAAILQELLQTYQVASKEKE